ncbi:MAG: GTP-binding protein [Acholeplasmatales bacterium]|nr:GTP-binding protein [Acholeplasmatales bacterium]
MLKIDIISGFLGAGKTTFIKRLLDTKLNSEKIVLIENEYGEVSVDSDILADAQIEVKELSQGCICCSLVGDFSKSLNEIINTYNPDRILIEPSGVGKLSDVVKAVADAGLAGFINSLVCMVDAKKAKMYDKNFGEFFNDQIENAQTVILSRMDISKEDTAASALEIIRKHNPNCVVISTPIKDLSDEELLHAYEGFDINLLNDMELHHEECECGCGHHHDHDEECECGHHHDHDEECGCGHHHHDHDEECECGCGHRHHDHDKECECGHHHDHDEECGCGHHHHHHHADEVFASVGIETIKKYDINNLNELLSKMANGEYGQIVRAKGIIQGSDNKWYMFNLTPEEYSIEASKAIPMGKIVVIGAHIYKEDITKLF